MHRSFFTILRVAAAVVLIAGVGILALGAGTDDPVVGSTSPVDATPPPGCVTLRGPRPWITLFSEDSNSDCVIVGEFQEIEIWNKGFDLLTIDWIDGEVELRPDENLSIGRAGEVFEPGLNALSSFPYQMPDIWVTPVSRSAAAALNDSGKLDAREVGMTLRQASAALEVDIIVDPSILPGPECWGATIPGDPYSPTFIIKGKALASSEIIEIIAYDSELDPGC